MNHCSSEGATVGIQPYLSSRLKFQFKTKNFKTQNNFNSISNQNTFQFQYQYPKLYFKILFNSVQIQIKMTESYHLCDLWEHTIVKIFKHDSKSELGLMLKQWIIFNKLENFNSIWNHPIDDFTPSGNLCYMNEHGVYLPYTPDTIYIKTQVFRLLRYYSPAPRNIARSDWATQNITHNMTSSIT